jgi:hypothetical protein
MDSLLFARDMEIRLVRRAMVNGVKVAIRAASVPSLKNHRFQPRPKLRFVPPRLAQLRLPSPRNPLAQPALVLPHRHLYRSIDAPRLVLQDGWRRPQHEKVLAPSPPKEPGEGLARRKQGPRRTQTDRTKTQGNRRRETTPGTAADARSPGRETTAGTTRLDVYCSREWWRTSQ